MNFSRFLTSPSAAGLSPPQKPLWVVERLVRKEKRARIHSIVHRALSLFFFDYCYFYRDTQREPLRRREAAGFDTGRRISFGSLQLEKTAEIQAIRAIAQALSEHVETFLSSTVEKCFAFAENWMKYWIIAKAYEREICLVNWNFTKVALIRIFASINEFIIVKEQ